jgi:hypothetical protein
MCSGRLKLSGEKRKRRGIRTWIDRGTQMIEKEGNLLYSEHKSNLSLPSKLFIPNKKEDGT